MTLETGLTSAIVAGGISIAGILLNNYFKAGEVKVTAAGALTDDQRELIAILRKREETLEGEITQLRAKQDGLISDLALLRADIKSVTDRNQHLTGRVAALEDVENKLIRCREEIDALHRENGLLNKENKAALEAQATTNGALIASERAKRQLERLVLRKGLITEDELLHVYDEPHAP